MKPLFHEFDYGGSHRKLFEEEGGMDFMGQGNGNFLVPNFYSHSYIEDPNYF